MATCVHSVLGGMPLWVSHVCRPAHVLAQLAGSHRRPQRAAASGHGSERRAASTVPSRATDRRGRSAACLAARGGCRASHLGWCPGSHRRSGWAGDDPAHLGWLRGDPVAGRSRSQRHGGCSRVCWCRCRGIRQRRLEARHSRLPVPDTAVCGADRRRRVFPRALPRRLQRQGPRQCPPRDSVSAWRVVAWWQPTAAGAAVAAPARPERMGRIVCVVSAGAGGNLSRPVDRSEEGHRLDSPRRCKVRHRSGLRRHQRWFGGWPPGGIDSR